MRDDFTPEFDDIVMAGIKNQLNSANRKKASLQLHRDSGHIGYHPDCQTCKWLRLRNRRLFGVIDKYIDPRPCFMRNDFTPGPDPAIYFKK
eukprot:SAG31_NODE_153_length_22196_cov_24.963570_8_plen_91_part_00